MRTQIRVQPYRQTYLKQKIDTQNENILARKPKVAKNSSPLTQKSEYSTLEAKNNPEKKTNHCKEKKLLQSLNIKNTNEGIGIDIPLKKVNKLKPNNTTNTSRPKGKGQKKGVKKEKKTHRHSISKVCSTDDRPKIQEKRKLVHTREHKSNSKSRLKLGRLHEQVNHTTLKVPKIKRGANPTTRKTGIYTSRKLIHSRKIWPITNRNNKTTNKRKEQQTNIPSLHANRCYNRPKKTLDIPRCTYPRMGYAYTIRHKQTIQSKIIRLVGKEYNATTSKQNSKRNMLCSTPLYTISYCGRYDKKGKKPEINIQKTLNLGNRQVNRSKRIRRKYSTRYQQKRKSKPKPPIQTNNKHTYQDNYNRQLTTSRRKTKIATPIREHQQKVKKQIKFKIKKPRQLRNKSKAN